MQPFIPAFPVDSRKCPDAFQTEKHGGSVYVELFGSLRDVVAAVHIGVDRFHHIGVLLRVIFKEGADSRMVKMTAVQLRGCLIPDIGQDNRLKRVIPPGTPGLFTDQKRLLRLYKMIVQEREIRKGLADAGLAEIFAQEQGKLLTNIPVFQWSKRKIADADELRTISQGAAIGKMTFQRSLIISSGDSSIGFLDKPENIYLIPMFLLPAANMQLPSDFSRSVPAHSKSL